MDIELLRERLLVNIRLGSPAMVLASVSVLASVIWFFIPLSGMRTIVGLILVVACPGFAFAWAAYPRKGDIEPVARILMALVVGMFLMSAVGIAVSYSPWGITAESTVAISNTIVLIGSLVAGLRSRLLPAEDRFVTRLSLPTLAATQNWLIANGTSVLVGVAAMAAIVSMLVAVTSPEIAEPYTELYVLGGSGEAFDYLRQLEVGRESKISVGIGNRQAQSMTFYLEAVLGGRAVTLVTPILVDRDSTWRGELAVIPEVPGQRQQLELRLFREGTDEVYRSVHFWVDVNPAGASFAEFYVQSLPPSISAYTVEYFALVIGNWQGKPKDYRVVATMGGKEIAASSVRVESNSREYLDMSLIMEGPGEQQELRFSLFDTDTAKLIQEIPLKVTVSAESLD